MVNSIGLSSALKFTVIEDIPHLQVRGDGMRFLRYVRNSEESPYVWMGSMRVAVPLLPGDGKTDAEELDVLLSRSCVSNETPWVLIVQAGNGKSAVVGGIYGIGSELDWKATEGILVLTEAISAGKPATA